MTNSARKFTTTNGSTPDAEVQAVDAANQATLFNVRLDLLGASDIGIAPGVVTHGLA
jgi:hypothetical protein